MALEPVDPGGFFARLWDWVLMFVASLLIFSGCAKDEGDVIKVTLNDEQLSFTK